MKCDQAEKWIHKHVDQELSVKQVGELRQHLTQCDLCTDLANELRAGKAWFVPSEAVAVPAGFAQRVTALAFEQEGRRPAGFSQEAPVLSHLPGGVGSTKVIGGHDRFVVRMAAVAAGLLAVLGLALYSQGVDQDRDLLADDQSFEKLIQEMDQANEGAKPEVQTPETKSQPQTKEESK